MNIDYYCFNRGGLCLCDMTFYGRDCARYREPATIATTETSNYERDLILSECAKGEPK